VVKNPILSDKAQLPQAFDLSMSDDALITFGAPVGPVGPFGPIAVSFLDTGFMPVNALTIGGEMQQLKGKLDGLFIQYNATGVQHFAAPGVPTTADYTTLHYELVGYKGDATFGHAADGTPTLSGAKHLTVLAQGDLLPGMGHLGFTPAGGIAGTVATSFQVNGAAAGAVNFTVEHSATDIGPAPGGFTLSGGTLHATFVPAVIV